MYKKIKRYIFAMICFTVVFKSFAVCSASSEESNLKKYERIIKQENKNEEDKKDYIVITKDVKDKKEILEAYKDADEKNCIEVNKSDTLLLEDLSAEQADMLENMNDLLIVEEDGIVCANKVEEEDVKTVIDEEWNIEMINADNLDLQSEGNSRVKVAIIDSGVDIGGDIPVYRSINFIPEEENVSPLFCDTTGHGTSVAGIIASLGEESNVKGINPNVELYSLKVLDDNNTSPVSRIIEAIYWCIDNDINIINMSFGTPNYSVALKNVVREAYDKGILMIASAGNTNGSQYKTEYPAAFGEVIAVGSVNSIGEVSGYSIKEPIVEIYAPGELIKTTGYFKGDMIVSGTSFSVPHIVGIASLLWEKDMTCSNQFIRELIKVSANECVDDNSGKSYRIADAEYALKIYEQFKETYDNNKNYKDIYNDNEKLEIDDSVNYVEGRWYSSLSKGIGHKTLADNAAEEVLGTTNSTIAKIVKRGATYPDKNKNEYYTLYGMTNNPQWHGNFKKTNYFACYIYATKLAIAGGDSTQITDIYERYRNDYNIMSSKVNQYAINMKTWDDILSDFNYSSKSAATQKKYREYFIWGMAMHIATDLYAHSTYDYNKNYIHHGAENEHNYADDPYYLGNGDVSNRWKAAQGTATEIYACIGSCSGDLYEFVSQYKYFDGSFYLGNVLWYADGVGINLYPSYYKSRLSKVATGNYIDVFIENY